MWHNVQRIMAEGRDIQAVDAVLIPVYVWEETDVICIIEYVCYDLDSRHSLCKLHQRWLLNRLDNVWLPPAMIMLENLSFRRLDIIEQAFYDCWEPAYEEPRD